MNVIAPDLAANARKYLERYNESGVLNQIDGEAVPAVSGEWFETMSPVDLAPLARVAKGGGGRRFARRQSGQESVPGMGGYAAEEAAEVIARNCRCHRSPRT